MGEFIAELLAFAVIIAVLWRYVVPRIRELMRSQQGVIRRQVEDVASARQRLEAAELKYREALAEARTEAAKIRDTARADAQRIVEEMRENAQREVERLRQRGQEDLESQRLQVIRELRARIGSMTVAAATELITAHLADDANRSATVDRFLDQLEAMAAPEREPAAKGGA
jgi:F-type H+-transporting ATPase subunit b